jgi:hypothetical protein
MKANPSYKIPKFLPLVFITMLAVVAGVFLIAAKPAVKLNRIEVVNDIAKTVKNIEIDTLETDPASGLYLVDIVHNGTSGQFWMSYGIMKRHGKDKQIVYEFPDPGNDKVYVNSGAYIMCVNNSNKQILKRYSKPDILINAKAAFASAELPADLACRPSEEE